MAGTPSPQARLFRFGPFELDVRAGELRKHGIRIKLREQPVQILLMLLDRPGEVVLRDEIRVRLWPNNTIVEFDHGINAAIQRVRDALGETADNPRHIETVARRGYRFLGEVERVGEAQPAAPPPNPLPAAEAAESGGRVLSHYRILDKLGEGGMGVVYRAEDLKLGRQVAVKFLPDAAHELPDSVLRRFEREARAASALNHPNICTIYGLEDLEGQPAIVMELLEGETLAARLAKGPLPTAQALSFAMQIAGALSEAHRRGVIHRDLKPANIMLTNGPPGVKVLDFGLASLESRGVLPAEAETLTQQGAILGTLHYMSPEQVQGKDADARSDIFSFGLVFYEMLTGRRAFDGENAASVMASILERNPPRLEPDGLNRVVSACLDKDPENRFQTARDLMRALDWSQSGGSATTPAPVQFRKWIPWAAAASVAALLWLVWLRVDATRSVPPRLTLTIALPSGPSLWPVGGINSTPEISPDGSSVLISSGGLWVRRLDSQKPVFLGGSEAASGPAFWSADSRTVIFPAARELMSIRVPDGAPEAIATIPAYSRGGTVSDRNDILISSGDRLWEVPASRHEARLVDVPGLKPGRYVYPQFLRGSEDFLFLLVPEEAEGSEVYLASLRDGKVANPVLLMKNDTPANYTPAGGGRILFVRNNNLYSQSLDRKQRKLMGNAELLEKDVASGPGNRIDRANFSVSDSGTIAWRPGKAALSQVTMFDRAGVEVGTAGPLMAVNSLALSPDEQHILAQGDGTWLLSPGQPGSLSQGKGWALWSPDGMSLFGRRASAGRLLERSTNGSSEVRELGEANGSLQAISPDGQQILTTNNGVFVARLRGTAQERAAKALIQNAGEGVFTPSFSPDGRWITYLAREAAGQSGVYVQSFPGPGLRRQIASSGPNVENWSFAFPLWRGDGKEIVFSSNRGVWSVRVDGTGDRLEFAAPVLLFSGVRAAGGRDDSVRPLAPAGRTDSVRPLAVSRDGSRFYFPLAVPQPDSRFIHVRTGWASR